MFKEKSLPIIFEGSIANIKKTGKKTQQINSGRKSCLHGEVIWKKT